MDRKMFLPSNIIYNQLNISNFINHKQIIGCFCYYVNEGVDLFNLVYLFNLYKVY